MAVRMPDTGSWFVIIPADDAGKPESFLRSVDFRVQFAPTSAQYAALTSGRSIQWNGMRMVYWKGPFATEADAKTAQEPTTSPYPAEGVVHDVSGAVTSTTQGVAKIGAFFEVLLHVDTWRSAGWILAGVILVIMGAVMWLKDAGLKALAV